MTHPEPALCTVRTEQIVSSGLSHTTALVNRPGFRRLLLPFEPLLLIWRHWLLIQQLTKRTVVSRYQNSGFGIVWSLLTPLFLVLVYTYVFSSIFQMRWGQADATTAEFGVVLFAGLIMFWLFSDCITRSPDLVVERSNFVKRVVFPLEILPIVNLGAALFHWGVSALVLVGAIAAVGMPLHPGILYLPLLLVPFCLVMLGVSWILAAVGVYVRDIGPAVSLVVTCALFLAPVFYPLSAVPERFHDLIRLNPLTVIIEQARAVALWGHPPDFGVLTSYTMVGWAMAVVGLYVFRQAKSGFADVI